MSLSRPRSYSYWGDHILHALPIASVINLFGTMIFLTFIFERWGLSAVQIVTPGDTIVTGIPLFAVLVLVGAVPWLVAVVIDLIPFKASPDCGSA